MSESDGSSADLELGSGHAEDANWDDWTGDEDDGDMAVKSLFCDVTLPSAEAAFDYDAKHHNFDLRKYKKEVGTQTAPHSLVRNAGCCLLVQSVTASKPRYRSSFRHDAFRIYI